VQKRKEINKMLNQKDQFKEILKYAYSKDSEENMSTQKLMDEIRERLQSLLEQNKGK